MSLLKHVPNTAQTRAWLLLLIAAVCPAFQGCSAGRHDYLSVDTRARVVGRNVTADDNEKLLVLRLGDTFTLSLEVQGAAGYQWQEVSVDGSKLAVTDRRFKVYTDRPGSAGLAVWNFQAVGAGDTLLVLRLCRPWDCERSTVKSFALGVRIEPETRTDEPK